jgi:hypothetical protein
MATLMPWLAELSSDESDAPMNMLDVRCHPEGFAKQMLKLDEVARFARTSS